MTGRIRTMRALTHLTQQQEARAVGRSPYAVLRARRDPTHPIHGPGAVQLGASKGAPEHEIRAWWPPLLPGQDPGDPGLTRRQWAAVVAIAAGTPAADVDSGYVLDRLTGWGLLADGQLTDLARALLTQHAADSATQQEKTP